MSTFPQTAPRWSYLANVRDPHPSTSPHGPWLAKSPSTIPAGISKEKFRKWCGDPSTTHVFYMPVIGLTPGARVSQDNPVHEMWALVGDYDCDSLVPMSEQEILDTMKRRLNGKGIMPTHMSRTFSNKIRLVWEFEAPLPGDVSDVLHKCVEAIVKETKAHAILPGFDDTSKFPGQAFELGHSWKPLGHPMLTSSMVAGVYFKSTQAVTMSPDTLVQVPIEVVAAEVERRWPGVWPGDFTVGAKGPLFWLNDGNPSIGAWVAENGIWSHSDRDHGWHSWSKLLGAAFVKQYEDRQIENVLDNFAYDGNRYWIKTPTGMWHDHPKENMVPRLKKMGFGESKVKGKAITALDETLIAIQDMRRVSGASTFLYWPTGLIEFQGKRYLNTSTRRPMAAAAAAAAFPFLWDYLSNFLEDDPEYPNPALDYMLAWMKRAWESATVGDPLSGHMIVLAGDTNTGKTLFSKHVMGGIMGGSEDASSFVLGQTQFNRELIDSGVWRIDDASPPKSEVDHARFTDILKKLVANGECIAQAKYRDQVTVSWRGRIILTCNMDAASQGILPNLGVTTLDKMLLFKVRERDPGFFPANVEEVIREELPHFLAWLGQWVVPQGVQASSTRFGVAHYHHHELVSTVRGMSAEQNLADLIELWIEEMRTMNPEIKEWRGNPTKLQVSMKSSVQVGPVTPSSAIAMGRYLKKLRENQYWRLSWNNTDNRNEYVIAMGK
jgi:hypothetical protein